MNNQENKTRLIDTPAAKRSIFLTLMGIPMMFVASFGSENIVCTALRKNFCKFKNCDKKRYMGVA